MTFIPQIHHQVKKENAFITTGKVSQEFHYIYTPRTIVVNYSQQANPASAVLYILMYWDTDEPVHLLFCLWMFFCYNGRVHT